MSSPERTWTLWLGQYGTVYATTPPDQRGYEAVTVVEESRLREAEAELEHQCAQTEIEMIRAERAEQALQEAREALAPFAELADVVDHWGHDDDSTCPHRLKAADVRRARGVLNKVDTE